MIYCKVSKKGTLASRLAEVRRSLSQRVERGLLAAGECLYNKSQPRVPVDIKALLNSGEIRQERTGFDTVVVVGYGKIGFMEMGFSQKEARLVVRIPADYAVFVHEDETKTHDTGMAKFLWNNVTRTDKPELITAFNVGAGI